MRRTTKLITAGGLLIGAATGAVAIGESLWRSRSKKLTRRLRDHSVNDWATYSPSQLAGLPEPVVRYFEHVLTPGQPIARNVMVRHSGRFRLGDQEEGRWVSFRSRQEYTTRPRGFVWDATMRLMPGVHVRVRDSYLDGRGSIFATLAGLVPVANEHERADLDLGALHRWLAEAVWFPTALLPGNGITWEGIDGNTAHVTLRDRDHEVSMEMTIDDHGEIVRAFTPSRMRDVDGTGVPTPWICHYHDYHRCGPVMVPENGEVEWVLEEGHLPYWRGRIDAIEYD